MTNRIRGAALAGGALAAQLVSARAFAQDEDITVEAVESWVQLATPYILKAVGALVLLVVARIVAG